MGARLSLPSRSCVPPDPSFVPRTPPQGAPPALAAAAGAAAAAVVPMEVAGGVVEEGQQPAAAVSAVVVSRGMDASPLPPFGRGSLLTYPPPSSLSCTTGAPDRRHRGAWRGGSPDVHGDRRRSPGERGPGPRGAADDRGEWSACVRAFAARSGWASSCGPSASVRSPADALLPLLPSCPA